MTTRLVILLDQKEHLLKTVHDAIRRRLLDAELVASITLTKTNTTPSTGTSSTGASPTDADDEATAAIVKQIKAHKADFIILGTATPLAYTAIIHHFAYRVLGVMASAVGPTEALTSPDQLLSAYERGEIKRAEVVARLLAEQNPTAGPILDKEALSIYRSDTLDLLSARIAQAEQRVLLVALRRLIEGDQ